MNTETWTKFLVSPTLPLTLAKFQLFPWFMQLFTNFATDISKILIISSNVEGNISEISEILIISSNEGGNTCPRYPSQGTQAMLTQETKKVWTLQPKPSQARGAAWGAAWGAAQARCRSAALPSDYITPPVGLVQHCSSRGAAQRSSRQQQQQGGWGGISLVCRLHNTITLHLTAVKLRASVNIHILHRLLFQ